MFTCRGVNLRFALIAVLMIWPKLSSSEVVTNVPHFRLDGSVASDAIGQGLAGIGDFNGDGVSDIAAGNSTSNANGQDSGVLFVAFGNSQLPTSLRGSDLTGSNGFIVYGTNPGDRLGSGVSACDINLDGRSDILVGANGVATNAGIVAVIYGTTMPQSPLTWIQLDGARGFRVTGTQSSSFGIKIQCAGDLAGDAAQDVLIGSGSGIRLFQHNPQTLPVVIDSSTMPFFSVPQESVSQRIASLGDVNGDGIDDFAAGSGNHIQGNFSYDAVYVIYGRADGGFGPWPGTPETGILFVPVQHNGGFGVSIAGLGDINGDGIDDIAIGEPFRDLGGAFGIDVGVAYVIYGRQGGLLPIDFNSIPSDVGFRIVGELTGDGFGRVASVGDVNRDGVPDLGVGALGADFNGSGSGSFYVMYLGGAYSSDVMAASLVGSSGMRLDGAAPNHNLGLRAAPAGDFNNDGNPDFVVSAHSASFSGAFSGSVYVVFGKGDDLFRDGFESLQ